MTTLTRKRWTPAEVDDLTEAVYKLRLEDDCKGNVERMLAKDQDDGAKLRSRSRFYRPMVMATLQALDLVEPAPVKKREA